MNGAFYNGRSFTAYFISCLVIVAYIIISNIITSAFKINKITIIVLTIGLFVIVTAVDQWLTKYYFVADEKSVSFRSVLKKYEFSYDDILDVKSSVVFIKRGYFRRFPHIQIILLLDGGKDIKFYDGNIPFKVACNSERLKEFYENHKFTVLAHFIKSRLSIQEDILA